MVAKMAVCLVDEKVAMSAASTAACWVGRSGATTDDYKVAS